jgi:hypothetical protein
MLIGIFLNNAECHYVEYCYAESHHAEVHYAYWHFTDCHYAECHYVEYRYAECHNAYMIEWSPFADHSITLQD